MCRFPIMCHVQSDPLCSASAFSVVAGRQYFEQAKAQEQLKDEDFIVDDEGEDFEDLLFARLQTGEFESDDDEDDEDEDFVPDDDDEDDA